VTQDRYEHTQRTLSGPIPALDGLRGIAILLVACGHFIGAYPVRSSADHVVFSVFRGGWCGVDLFFVLSGFLITGILVETRSSPNYFKAFYMRRVLRIFPLYYAFLAVWFFGLGSVSSKFGWDPAAIGLDRQHWYWLYISNWMVPAHDSIPALGHMWSLAVEEQFYLVWPLVVWIVGRRSLAWVCVVAVLAAPIVRCALLGYGSDAPYEWTPARMDSLALGGLLAVSLRSHRAHAWIARWWRVALGVALCGLAVVAIIERGFAFNTLAMQTAGYSLLALGAGAAIAGAIVGGTPFRRVFELRVLRSFGKYSYGIYVIHYPFYAIAVQTIAPYDLFATRAGYAAFMIGGIACCYALAWLSWHLFERHFLALKRLFVAERTGR
jgi:peptidoglycan/LPS O-acetylase OafA/YrhL